VKEMNKSPDPYYLGHPAGIDCKGVNSWTFSIVWVREQIPGLKLVLLLYAKSYIPVVYGIRQSKGETRGNYFTC
jgi:hypothetical protein